MANSHAEIFSSLRIKMIDTLVESRHAIDDAFGTLPESTIRSQFETVIDQMYRGILDSSATHFHQSVLSWTAALLGLGLSPRSALRTVVTIGDLLVQVAKHELPATPGTNLFVREVVRLNFRAARLVVEIFDAELESLRKSDAREPLNDPNRS